MSREVNLGKRRVLIAGNEVHLTRDRLQAVCFLIRHADQVVAWTIIEGSVGDPITRIKFITCGRVYMLQLRCEKAGRDFGLVHDISRTEPRALDIA